MMVTYQIDAPMRKLVVPRVVGTTVTLPLLAVLACVIGVAGGAVISRTQLRVADSVYWNNVISGCGSRTCGWA